MSNITAVSNRVEHLMEKERLFRELYVQNKSSQCADGISEQLKSASDSKAKADTSSKLGTENCHSPSLIS